MVYDGTTPKRTLLPDELTSSEFEVPMMTAEEIQDRSKANILSKGLVLLQTGWFVVQVIARKAEGLTVTELEVVTLAFASLNFVIYGLWWQKPLDVKRPTRVYEKGGIRDARVVQEDRDFGNVLRCKKSSWWDSVVKLWKKYSVGIFFAPLIKMTGGDDDEPLDSSKKRVKTFYSGKLSENEAFGLYLMSWAVGAGFGAIHFLAWSYPFPSQTERILWRVSSVLITFISLCVVLSFAIDKLSKWLGGSWVALGITWLVLLMVYIACRVLLLMLPFMSLRSLPPDAYRTVTWTTFVPHIH